jgi:hypothetical protein
MPDCVVRAASVGSSLEGRELSPGDTALPPYEAAAGTAVMKSMQRQLVSGCVLLWFEAAAMDKQTPGRGRLLFDLCRDKTCCDASAPSAPAAAAYLGYVGVPDRHEVAGPLVELAADCLQQTGPQQPGKTAAAAAVEQHTCS